jgi:RNA polymerase sigma-70 factor (ECF subfamily)
VGTVKSRANRGRKRLAELLKLEAGEELEMTDRATLAVMAQNHPVSR